MSDVALVFPYFRTRSRTEILFPPLGVASLAAQLRALGVETTVIDCTFATLPDVRAALTEARPEIVGVSSLVSVSANARSIAQLAREVLPDSLLVAGGPLPTAFPRRFTPVFDAVFRGEADLSFPRLCADYLGVRGERQALSRLPLATYPGLVAVVGGRHIDNPPIHHDEREIAAFPLPDRSGFDHVAYQRVWLEQTGSRVTSIVTTFGCPYACDFCSRPVFGSRVRRRDLDQVFTEIEELVRLGYDGLWIADDTFTLNLPFVEEFCRRMRGRGLSWSCLARARGIDGATARLMKRAGCRRVYLGLESGSDATLKLMNKQTTVADGARTTHTFRAAGIEVAAFFIVGYPGEDVPAIEATLRLALTLPLDEISFNVPLPLPGSPLFERLGAPDEDRDWTRENEVAFVYPSAIDQQWLRRRIDDTMEEFARRRPGATSSPGA